VVEGDRSQLLELFQNLIGNSLKFRSEEKPLVRISAARDNGMWRVTVADNGIGIEPAYREKVFAVFQRLHTRSEYPGTGIGLALCKRVVERHGGAIWIEPGSREGTTIHLTLKGADGAGDR
jgi:light-regulated signal transduction histidine kinase (bacteriophytochrome)